MALTATRAAITATASVIVAVTGRGPGRRVWIRNAGANEVYLGPAAVTSATGFELAAGASLPHPLELGPDDDLSAICAAAETTALHVLTASR